MIHQIKDRAAMSKNRGRSLYALIWNGLQDSNIEQDVPSVHGVLLPTF